ncbi:MAG: glycosyltransferase family 4 protein [Bacteroidia bacterium]|nr:glycosyltransferase family 4 protein [Bacteroidia bacterium]
MKVLWFSNTAASGGEYLKLGGLGGGWLCALDQLLRNKVELSVVFHYPKYAVPFIYQGCNYYPICSKNWEWEMFKNIFCICVPDDEFLLQYLQIIKDVKPDIIHILGSENSFGIIAEQTNIPVVESIQGNITVYKQKFFSGIERKYSHKRAFTSFTSFITSQSYFSNFMKFEKMSKIERRNLKNIKHIIGRTDWDRRIMTIMASGAHYYHNDEVLRNSFYELCWKPQKREKLIIHTTNGNSIYKGFETLCEALFEISQLGISIEWRVAGIKEGDVIVQIVKKKLKERFPSRGLVLLGGLSESQLAKKLLEADLYVMPSHIENSPNNLCEAMILGMPCIATFAGGTGSMLQDGEEGILIQDGDPWAMAGAILELAKQPDKAIQYGIKARERALQRHDKERVVNELLAIYHEITEKSKIADSYVPIE